MHSMCPGHILGRLRGFVYELRSRYLYGCNRNDYLYFLRYRDIFFIDWVELVHKLPYWHCFDCRRIDLVHELRCRYVQLGKRS